MNIFYTSIIYIVTIILLGLSFMKDKKKTFLALKKAWKMFITVLPQFLAILLLVGLILAVFEKETIQKVIGTESGVIGMIISSLIGTISLIPVLIAFPIASELLQNGAGLMQITVFISTLTTVGFVTLPLESRYLGKKVAVLRNMFAFLFSFVVSFIIGAVLS